MIIIGAGLSGLIAGRILQTKFIKPTIFEAQGQLPNNHSAVLRFRSSLVGDRTAIPFRRVTMIKCVHPVRNPVADALTYSYKCSGEFRSDRSVAQAAKTEERFIAPHDFIRRLAADLDIEYTLGVPDGKTPTISTMPMPRLMDVLGYKAPRPDFRSIPGMNIRFTIYDCDAYVSVYDPDPNSIVARISVTGGECICECPNVTDLADGDSDFAINRACELLGIKAAAVDPASARISWAKYSKILPIDEKIRKDFMHWATEKHNVYSLGRFATWKPGLLLDDIVKDIDQIVSWARVGGSYSRRFALSAAE